MQRDQLRRLLEKVRHRHLSLDEALAALAHMPYEDLGKAKVDHHRALRCGFAEVIFGPGKQPDDLVHIVEEGLKGAPCILSTRLSDAQVIALNKHFPQAVHNVKARTVRVGAPTPLKTAGDIVVITAGTSDIPVAEEAVETLRACGGEATTFYDVGVAGLHRLVNVLPLLQQASALICVAGMDGALPSVVGGMVSCPVIAVPTSIGYGANLNGLAALLAMLNTCATGVSVVNIDNGFGAAMCALRMVTSRKK
ncbi:MAG: nickel pincer cofactor biosynthesis protein LarB [Planctomycetota bacterium]